MRRVFALVLSLVLAGCADNPPSRAYLAFSDRLEMATLRDRYADSLNSDEFAPLKEKVDLSQDYKGEPITCESAQSIYASPPEQAALHRWAELRIAYFTGIDALLTHAAKASNETAAPAYRYAAILSETLKRSTALISDLADGKMTYCDFLERDRKLTLLAKWQARPLQHDMEAAMSGKGYDPRDLYPDEGPLRTH